MYILQKYTLGREVGGIIFYDFGKNVGSISFWDHSQQLESRCSRSRQTHACSGFLVSLAVLVHRFTPVYKGGFRILDRGGGGKRTPPPLLLKSSIFPPNRSKITVFFYPKYSVEKCYPVIYLITILTKILWIGTLYINIIQLILMKGESFLFYYIIIIDLSVNHASSSCRRLQVVSLFVFKVKN